MEIGLSPGRTSGMRRKGVRALKEANRRRMRHATYGFVGIVAGVISVILGMIAKVTLGFLMGIASATYLEFAQVVFLGSIAIGVFELLQPGGE